MLVPKWVGLCTLQAPVGLSKDLSYEAGSLSCCPNPHRHFQSRFEALFPCAGALGCVVCLATCHLSGFSVHKCVAAGATHCSACPVLHHSESGPLGLSERMWGRRVCQWSDCLLCWSHTPPVWVPPRPRESSPPLCPSPPLLPVWMNVYFLSPWCRTSLPFDFLSLLVVRGGAVCLPMPPS